MNLMSTYEQTETEPLVCVNIYDISKFDILIVSELGRLDFCLVAPCQNGWANPFK